MRINKSFLVLASLSFIGISAFLGFYIYVGWLFWNHWSLTLFRCSKCMDSFWMHFFSLDQFLISGLFILMTFLFGRSLFVIWKELKMQKFVDGFDNDQDFYVVDDFVESALVAGFVRPKVFVNSNFWNSLNDKERVALIEHEKAHVGLRHGLQFVMLGIVKSLYGIGILDSLLQRLFDELKLNAELEADELVLEKVEKIDLVSVLYKGLKFENQCLDVISSPGISSSVLDRVNVLLKGESVKSRLRYGKMYGSLASFSFCFGLLVSVIQPLSGCLS